MTLAQKFSGSVTVATVGLLDPCLYGCLGGIAISAFVTITISIFKPENYNWESLAAVRVLNDKGEEVDVSSHDESYDPEKLRKAAVLARSVTLFLFLALFIIWPLSMYGSGYIFGRKFFQGWVIVSVLWAFFAFFAVTLFPIVEGRHTLLNIVSGGRFGVQKVGQTAHADAPQSEDTTPRSGSIEEKEQ